VNKQNTFNVNELSWQETHLIPSMNYLSTFLILSILLEVVGAFLVGVIKLRNDGMSAATTTTRLAGAYTDKGGETLTSTTITSDGVDSQAKKFKIITCMSTSCCQKRKSLGMDSLSTFGAMFSRAQSSKVQVEEGPCLGSCKRAPCIGIEHEDFIGSVALDGMTDDEFVRVSGSFPY
jgi:hypothetical protein